MANEGNEDRDTGAESRVEIELDGSVSIGSTAPESEQLETAELTHAAIAQIAESMRLQAAQADIIADGMISEAMRIQAQFALNQDLLDPNSTN